MHPRSPIMLLWICLLLSAGVSRGEEKWTHYLSGNDILDMTVRGDSLWCAAKGSIVRWDIRNHEKTQYLSPYHPFLATVAPDGSPWIVNSSFPFSVYHLVGTEWVRIPEFTFSDSYEQILSLIIDRAENVWAGTKSSGVLRYDGAAWRQFPGNDSPVIPPRVVVTDDTGAVWIGAYNGLYRYYKGNWRRFSTEDGLAGNSIRCLLAAPDGTLWVGSASGVSRFDSAGWKTYTSKNGLSSNGINAMTADRDGKIWFGTDNGVSCFDGAAWKAWKGNAEYFIDPKVTGIAADSANRIWMSHRGIGKGVTVFDGSQWKWYTTYNADIPTNTIESVAAGSDGVLWFATDQGALRHDGMSWKSYTTQDGLVSSAIREIVVDRNNRAWALYSETENAGATRLDAEGPVSFSTSDGLSDNTVLTLASDAAGAIWFGTPAGLARLDGKTWETFPDPNRLLSPKISGIAEDSNGVLWFATGHGLARFDGSSWRTYRTDMDTFWGEVTAITPQGNETVWCMAGNALLRFKNGVFTAAPVRADSFVTGTFITHIAVDLDGAVWTDGDTVGNINDSKRKILYFKDGEWKTVTLPWPSSKTAISKILVDKNNVKWFSTDSGLVRLEGDSATTWPVENPIDYPIHRVAVDREDVKWFISGMGIGELSSYNGKERRDYPDRYFYTVTVDSRNRKWFTTMKELVCYDGNTWSDPILPPKPSWIKRDILAIDENDVLWTVIDNNDPKSLEIGSYDGVEWKMFSSGGIDLSGANKLAVDRSGTKWFLFSDKGPVSFDGAEWKTYPEAPIPEGGRWCDMAVDRDGVKWFASDGGVLSFDGKIWRKYPAENGFPFSAAYTVIVDRLNVKWFGTNVNPVSYDGTGWKIHEAEKGITMGISSMTVDMDNRKWIVWSDGYALSVLDDRPGADTGNIPVAFSLRGNYPNPFNAGTSIAFDLSVSGRTRLTVYDILGRRVREIDAGKMPVGRNVITWNGADDRGKRASSGVYLYRVHFGGATKTGRMLLLK